MEDKFLCADSIHNDIIQRAEDRVKESLRKKVEEIHETYSFEAGVDITNIHPEDLRYAEGIKIGMEQTKKMVLSFLDSLNKV